MDIQAIPLISISYNSAELVEDLLGSFRQHYRNPITIIDGSNAEYVPAIASVCARYPDVKLIHFDYNIHHGPGMAWAFQNLELQGPVLVLDSDVIVLNPGLLEALAHQLKPGMYGVGYVNYVNEGGFDVDDEVGAVRYLHPACMLCNIDVVRQWPMPIKHGAPNIEPMLAIHHAGKHELIQGLAWVKEDFSRSEAPKHFLRHDWQGTVKRTGGYHLEEWERSAQEIAKVRIMTLTLLPVSARTVVEVGANDGALARAYKGVNSECRYKRLAIGAGQSSNGIGACDQDACVDLYGMGDDLFSNYTDTNCWVLDQVLERIVDPALLLSSIRKVIGNDGSVVAVIPNAQHWSIQAKLCIGDFRYSEAGLMQACHLRWFTRATIFELFQNAGFRIVEGFPVIHDRIANTKLMAAIKQFAESVGADPDLSFEDSQACQYIVKAVPV